MKKNLLHRLSFRRREPIENVGFSQERAEGEQNERATRTVTGKDKEDLQEALTKLKTFQKAKAQDIFQPVSKKVIIIFIIYIYLFLPKKKKKKKKKKIGISCTRYLCRKYSRS